MFILATKNPTSHPTFLKIGKKCNIAKKYEEKHLAVNQLVAGSNPAAGAIFKSDLIEQSVKSVFFCVWRQSCPRSSVYQT